MTEEIREILAFWFGVLDDAGMPAEDRNPLWFQSSPDTDRQCADAFGDLVQLAVSGGLPNWESDDRGLVALIILLDQFTRNIYRGTPEAFSGDVRALSLAQHAIETGHFQRLPAVHQAFLFMPLEHAEDPDVQEECVTLFSELAAITGNAQITSFLRFAEAHRDVIARFGRFPHRNAILGRESTAEELDYLATHGGF